MLWRLDGLRSPASDGEEFVEAGLVIEPCRDSADCLVGLIAVGYGVKERLREPELDLFALLGVECQELCLLGSELHDACEDLELDQLASFLGSGGSSRGCFDHR